MTNSIVMVCAHNSATSSLSQRYLRDAAHRGFVDGRCCTARLVGREALEAVPGVDRLSYAHVDSYLSILCAATYAPHGNILQRMTAREAS